MGQKSKIEWTDATWNPVTGCTKVSTGCKHCYAERLFPRVYGRDMVPIENPAVALANEETDRPREFTDVWLHPERLEQPLHWKKPRMIFVNSMSDLFHEDIPFEFIHRIFAVMAKTEQHTFQILTKRPKIMLKYTTKLWGSPLKNVWFGISCENQETADERIPLLLQLPAAVRFLSCEPLLDEIDLREPLNHYPVQTSCRQYVTRDMAIDAGDREFEGSLYSDDEWEQTVPEGIDWVIVGGESGPGYRPMNLDWARSIRDQCTVAGVPFFFKQTAGKKAIPDDLMIREYPK